MWRQGRLSLKCAVIAPQSSCCATFPNRTRRGSADGQTRIDPPRPAPEFALPSTGGAEFRLSRQLGKVIVLTFGYTSCPDICPTVLAELAQVRERLATWDIALAPVDHPELGRA